MIKDTVNNGAFRRREQPFAQVSNAALRDENLSLKAKGLYSLIQSYITIPDFTLYKWFLQKHCKEGDRAFNSAWNELKEYGYLKQYRIPGGDNGFFVYQYELLDVADLSQPPLLNLKLNGEVSLPKDHEVQNVDDDTSQDDNHTLHNAPNGFSTTSKIDAMQNEGDINNTDSNNTDPNHIEESGHANNEKRVENFSSKKLITKEQYINDLKERLDYNKKTADMDDSRIALIDTIIGFIGDLLVCRRRSLRIDQQTIRLSKLKPIFLNMDIICIEQVCDNLSTFRSKISNLKQYVWTSLYNTYVNLQHFQTLEKIKASKNLS